MTRCPIPLLAAILLSLPAVHAENVSSQVEVRCSSGQRLLAPAGSPDRRKYAPDRRVDILHLAIDVTPNFEERSVVSTTEIRFRPIAFPLEELELDAVNLRIHQVTSSEEIEAWHDTGEQLIITFARPVPVGREARVSVAYRAEPDKGLYFRTPELGYRDEDTHLFTQGEAIQARHWYPCFDAPNERFTSEVTCHVPKGMIALSNGRLISESEDADTGLVSFRWLQEQTHVNYLIALVAGYFEKIDSVHRDIPLTFYTPPSQIQYARNSFEGTVEMMKFFEMETGVPYPWAKYAQVCVQDFVAGGMENTSLTILADRTLFPAETENLRGSEGLVAHELAHQWFGDLVTCKDWSHIWLNEGFATYYDALYAEHRHGRDLFLWQMERNAQRVLGQANDTRPIVWREFDRPAEQFSYLAYPKGAWILHMLRSQLGEDLFRKCVKVYLNRHRFGNVVTEDLNRVLEEQTGRSFDQFLDQWVYHAHYPELEIRYRWDQRTKQARVTVRQVQKLSDQVLLFRFPLSFRFRSGESAVDREVLVSKTSEDFHFSLAEAPEVVRVDPEFTLLAKVKFDAPQGMLLKQLEDENDMIGRLRAVQALAGRKKATVIARLKETLATDPFHGIRLEASKALRKTGNEAAFQALLSATQQPDARVRRQVYRDLRGFYRPEVLAAARAALEEERNPEIAGDLLRILSAYGSDETVEYLKSRLDSESFRDLLLGAAIRTMRAQDDPEFVDPLLQTLERRHASMDRGVCASGLTALAWLARHREDKTPVREFLVDRLQDKRERVKRAALEALGTLGDRHALPVVETFTLAAEESPERKAADRAVSALRDTRPPAMELRTLREEVMRFGRDKRELEGKLEALEKQVEALRKERTGVDEGGNNQDRETPDEAEDEAEDEGR